jgi:alkanesulfonate monooxygenase SsuD/methylene tetrahydromethanopterin reductase-like flavin-dependent oxidoreductase (luciferase family)
MEIGMNLPIMVPGFDRDRIHEWCRRIDAGPYSSLAVGERINFPNHAAMVTLSVAAAVTERVRIMPYVLIMPMHSEVAMAKELATLDILCEGRLTLGVGAGAREEDYRSVGAPFGKRRMTQLQEQVACMKRVWSGEVIGDALRPVEPRPRQEGGPPILVASLSDKSIRHASRWADGIAGFSFGPSPDDVNRCFETARQAWQRSDREREPRLVASFWFALGSHARAQLDDYLHRYLNFMGEDVSRQLAATVAIDTKQKLVDAVRRIEDCGADEVSLVPTTWDMDELSRVEEASGGGAS